MKNKGLRITLFMVVVIVGFAAIFGITGYNSLISKEAEVDTQWATVESKLQRRYDLIPNLVNAVKGSMAHENEVFGNITDARTKMSGAKTVKEVSNANAEMEGALNRLMVVMENYPELKSNDNVNTLMTQLEGTENRISVERDRFNKTVKDYNLQVQRFPKSVVASMTGFKKKDFFEADKGAEKAPVVDLTTNSGK